MHVAMREKAESITRLKKKKRGRHFFIDHLRGYAEATRWRYEVCSLLRMPSTDNKILNIHMILLSEESRVDFGPGSVKNVECKNKSPSILSIPLGVCGDVFNNRHISKHFGLTPISFKNTTAARVASQACMLLMLQADLACEEVPSHKRCSHWPREEKRALHKRRIYCRLRKPQGLLNSIFLMTFYPQSHLIENLLIPWQGCLKTRKVIWDMESLALNYNGKQVKQKLFSHFMLSIDGSCKDHVFHCVDSLWSNRHSHTSLMGKSIGTESVGGYLPKSLKYKK